MKHKNGITDAMAFQMLVFNLNKKQIDQLISLYCDVVRLIEKNTARLRRSVSRAHKFGAISKKLMLSITAKIDSRSEEMLSYVRSRKPMD